MTSTITLDGADQDSEIAEAVKHVLWQSVHQPLPDRGSTDA
jgi:hypothetical protein